ncbi:hypothetical protein [Spirosoma oryzicola]|uniref:hypothetical protein n=1 Tax=Spirosoma oryzicola TaxID=2898794 RepID=UPI001E501364|nr:hypothetical protein [Spirosoma oryzicola]UHG94942.1 hypothetical protein LQ777_29980 [Spirosoma oryzicola]
MNIFKRLFSDKKKTSLSDRDGFLRLQTEDMEAILGGRPIGSATVSLDIETERTNGQLPLPPYSHSENSH